MTHEPTLVIMAAGMGSRFGGLKQMTPVDEEGHFIIDFSLYDAYQAGFRRVAFIIKREIEQTFRETIGARMEKWFHVDYVYQELDRLPEGFAVPEGRRKPWRTRWPAAGAWWKVRLPSSTPMIFMAGARMRRFSAS